MKTNTKKFLRYVANGMVATAVHYAILFLSLEILKFKSAGVANLVAACFGIAASFLGSRYYVFKGTCENLIRQAIKFSGLYTLIALIHGLILWLWTDNYGLSYHIGFLLATVVQISLSYIGNKFWVFNK